MTLPDFTIDYDTEVPHFDDQLKLEIENRLTELAGDHTDMIGAAVAITQPARETTPFIFQARIVVYMRPDDVAAVKMDDTVEGAVKAALSAIERQVREKREKLRETWKRPDIPGTPES